MMAYCMIGSIVLLRGRSGNYYNTISFLFDKNTTWEHTDCLGVGALKVRLVLL